MISHARIAVNNVTPTQVTPIDDTILQNTNCTIQIQNLGSDPVYIGDLTITNISYGCSIAPGATLTIDDLPPLDEVYVLSSVASGYVGVLKVVR